MSESGDMGLVVVGAAGRMGQTLIAPSIRSRAPASSVRSSGPDRPISARMPASSPASASSM